MSLLGHIHFDSPGSKSDISDLLALKERSSGVFRNKYVKMDSTDKKTFLGRIVEGPFFIPEEVARDSAFAQTSILHGEEFKALPNFYTMARLEILGEMTDQHLHGTNTRPLPKTPVNDLTEDEIQKIIGIEGDMIIGLLAGYGGVQVKFNSESKKVLPRNIGIFGTVGSGKTNTSQVLIEEASKLGYAVIVVDVEGEYVDMDKPTSEKNLFSRLEEFSLQPRGLKNFKVYHPEASEPTRSDSEAFGVPFNQIRPHVISELADLTEPQEGMFLKIVETLSAELGQKRGARRPKTAALAFLEGNGQAEGLTLQAVIDRVPEVAAEIAQKGTQWALTRKLMALRRTNMFDTEETLDVKDLLQQGRVSILDVSGVTNDAAKNLAIAWILRIIFEAKLRDQKAPKTLVVIEEAHTFVSRESKERMTATLDMLKIIARRGRKRWLGLVFISQQPSHLPDEIFELCNTRFVHGIKSEHNLNPLRRTSGDVISELWDMVPGLGPGQALIMSPQFNHTILADVRPSQSRRRLTE
jgi:DNA helicase HerA-like ATPase